jgi:hypothetical protein
MATFKVKKNKETIVVTVELPKLPSLASKAMTAREIVRERDVRAFLASEGVESEVEHLLHPTTASNYNGAATTVEFVFHRKYPQTDEKPKKDLTTPPEPVIIEAQPKKRKRVKRDSNTGNKTTS